MIYFHIILAFFATAQANAEIALQTKNRQIIFGKIYDKNSNPVSYTHLRAHETP